MHTHLNPITSLRTKLHIYAPLPLRLITGFGFLNHGLAKLNRGIPNFTAILTALHVPFPNFAAHLTIATEILGGAALLAGAFLPLISIPLAIVLITATLSVHLPLGFSSIRLQSITPTGPQFGPVGYELNLLYLAALATLVMSNPTPFSLDAWRKPQTHRVPPPHQLNPLKPKNPPKPTGFHAVGILCAPCAEDSPSWKHPAHPLEFELTHPVPGERAIRQIRTLLSTSSGTPAPRQSCYPHNRINALTLTTFSPSRPARLTNHTLPSGKPDV